MILLSFCCLCLVPETFVPGDAQDFVNPTDLAVHQSGRLFVVDAGDTRVLAFQRDGSLDFAFGRKGQGPGEFQSPTGIGFLADGSLVVADQGDWTLKFFDSQGVFQRQLKFQQPFSQVLALPEGRLLLWENLHYGAPFSFQMDDSPPKHLAMAFDQEGNPIRGYGSYRNDENPIVKLLLNQGEWQLDGEHLVFAPTYEASLLFFEHLELGVKQTTIPYRPDFVPRGVKGKMKQTKQGENISFDFGLEHADPVCLGLAALGDGQYLILKTTREATRGDDLPTARIQIIDRLGQQVRFVGGLYRARAMAVSPAKDRVYLLEMDDEDRWQIQQSDL